jgi:hypothetical protein
MRKSSKLSAYTFVELLLLIAILVTLFGLAIPQFLHFKSDAKVAALAARFSELREGLLGNSELIEGRSLRSGLIKDVGEIPSELTALIEPGKYALYDAKSHKGWQGPYVQKVEGWNFDPWSQPILISPLDKTLRSCGPDKACNSEDDIVVSLNESN